MHLKKGPTVLVRILWIDPFSFALITQYCSGVDKIALAIDNDCQTSLVNSITETVDFFKATDRCKICYFFPRERPNVISTKLTLVPRILIF